MAQREQWEGGWGVGVGGEGRARRGELREMGREWDQWAEVWDMLLVGGGGGNWWVWGIILGNEERRERMVRGGEVDDVWDGRRGFVGMTKGGWVGGYALRG